MLDPNRNDFRPHAPGPRTQPQSDRSVRRPAHPVRYRPPFRPRPRPATSRLLIASNRLPVVLEAEGEGGWKAEPAAGGLVTALSPVMKSRGGLWVGWPGVPGAGDEELRCGLEGAGPRPFELRPVKLSEGDRERFYDGFSNQALWPLLHGMPERSLLEPGHWTGYLDVNRRFARVLARTVEAGDLVWIHDYHLMLVARELRALGIRNRLAFFLHTPFPSVEAFATLPHHRALLQGLLAFDLVGFQTERDRASFEEAVEALLPENQRKRPAGGTVPREVRTGAFPISIDYEEFAGGARNGVVQAMAQAIRDEVGPRTLLLGVDRLDYTKGIAHRLRELDRALTRYPELRGRVVLRQLVVPSRGSIPAYAATRSEIERLVAVINGRWGTPEWTPVLHTYGRWSRSELLAHYRAADAAVVAPLNDGMNLVAKEYCASNSGTGVLILSSFAGAAEELGSGAFLVDPTVPGMTAAAIRDAHGMAPARRIRRMDALRRKVARRDVHRWVESLLEAVP